MRKVECPYEKGQEYWIHVKFRLCERARVCQRNNCPFCLEKPAVSLVN